MGIRNAVRHLNQKAADQLQKAAALSPKQLEQIDNARNEYLSQKPDPNDPQAVVLTNRLLGAAGVEIFNAYLPQLSTLYLPADKNAEYGEEIFSPDFNIRYIHITKWVANKKENSLEKLVNVYQVLSNEDCNIALIFHRSMDGTDVYLAVTNTQNDHDNVNADNYRDRLEDAIRGNFPGAEFDAGGSGIPPCLRTERSYSIASASNIPTEKSEKFLSQTIEKLLDGTVPDELEKEYTLILLATPVLDVEERKMRLAEIYSGLAPYAGWSTQFTFDEHRSVGNSATFGVNVGASAGIQNGTNSSITDSNAQTDSENQTVSDASGKQVTDATSNGISKSNSTSQSDSVSTGESNSHTKGIQESDSHSEGINDSESENETKGSNDNVGIGVSVGDNENVGVEAGLGRMGVNAGVGVFKSLHASYSHGWNRSRSHGTSHGKSETDAHTAGTNEADTVAQNSAKAHQEAKAVANAVSKQASHSVGNSLTHSIANTLGKAVTRSTAITNGIFRATNFGANFGANFARSSTITVSIGKSEGITQNFTNYNIKHSLQLLEEQMKRYEQSTALGMWDFAAYVISEDVNVANNVAHDYIALTQGEKSYMSSAAINLWRGDTDAGKPIAREIYGYLQQLRHPMFGLNPEVTGKEPDFMSYPSIVTAATPLTGKELAYSLNFPRKSVTGLPVIECTEFARNIVSYDTIDDGPRIHLGHVFHMYHDETQDVSLSLNSMTSHTFITGSTGAGKSNTVYQILSEAKEQGVQFLVIEPAKGEYRNVFGMDADVSVYGTNPKLTPMLRINPFSFPDGIHILEHLDRLVEIFNVCWAMYAAMPAVLKNAVEKAYEDAGWDLVHSENRYREKLYPTFADVAQNVKEIIDTSAYDAENKGAYKGSLLNRLESLTNGINGMVFVQDEIPEEDLFDRNVIIDLSRVGSSETKALLMGMLVLKLQEHRMAAGGMNSNLKHLTVLEEAHNLLKRTSSVQSSESEDLAGKSVEMLANAIAEMRTYGEGFIIADQAPGLLDLSVIRNTNTKIIMRLPDREDRELTGKAANLDDEQIDELGRLPRGVAAIYQNEWIEPVLCRIDRCSREETPYVYTPSEDEDVYSEKETHLLTETILDRIMKGEILGRNGRKNLELLREKIVNSRIGTRIKTDMLSYMDDTDDSWKDDFEKLVYDFLHADAAFLEEPQKNQLQNQLREWTQDIIGRLNPSVEKYSEEQIRVVMLILLCEQSRRDHRFTETFNAFSDMVQDTLTFPDGRKSQ